MLRNLTAASLVFAILLCASCNGVNKRTEGVIYYDVSFPFLENSVLKNIFPEEMKMTFKDDKVKGELRSLGGIVTSGFICDSDTHTFSQMLKSYQDHYVIELQEDGINSWLGDQPGVRLESTNDTLEVAGFLCHKTIAHFLIDSVPPVILYHTDEISIDDPNWFTQYHDIDGVLLGYEIEQFGMRMKLMAREVKFQIVDETSFEIPDVYAQISPEEMSVKIGELLEGLAE